MLAKNWFFVILFIINCSFIHSMEKFPPNRMSLKQIREKEINNAGLTGVQKSYFELLPEELVDKIFPYFVKSGENFKKSIENFHKFNEVLSKTRGINYTIKNFTERHVIFFSKCLKINPFILARRLKVKLSDELKEKFREQVLEQELKNHELSHEDLDEWLNKNNVDVKSIKEANSNFTKYCSSNHFFIKNTKELKLGILAYLRLGVNPDAHWSHVDNGKLLTPLRKAIDYINKDLVSILLNFGADPNYINQFRDNGVDRPLPRAATKHNNLLDQFGRNSHFLKIAFDIMKLLLEAGANHNEIRRPFTTALAWEEFTTTDLLKSSSETKSSSCLVS